MNANTNETRNKAVWGGRVGLAVMLALALLGAVMLASCSETIRSGEGSSYLVLTNLSGAAGAPVESDVISDTGGIAADSGTATFQLNMKDVLNQPTANNAITLTQYRVEYVRSDGHNVQGVDVPYAFDGGMSVTISTSGSASFTLVRIQAKQEAPLRALRIADGLFGGQKAITAIARVTFYGHDQTGRGVSVTGNIEVTFADFAG